MKILIAIPCMDQVPTLFTQSLACLNKVGECRMAFQMGSLVYTARNDLATYAMKEGFDYVLWLDSDMVFQPDLLERLLKHMDEETKMITGVYYKRRSPYSPVLFKTLEPRSRGGWEFSDFDDLPKKGLFEVAGCGFGCVLMATEVILDVQLKHGYLFSPMNNGGEDVSFCWRARQCGYRIMCDPEITCGHVGSIVISDALYKQCRQLRDN